MGLARSLRYRLSMFETELAVAARRLDLSVDGRVGLRRLRQYQWGWRKDGLRWGFLAVLALLSLIVMRAWLLFKLALVLLYTAGLLLPVTSQFLLPATPVFSWLLLYFSSQFIPNAYRPHIWVSVLPTLESILYGGNISDFLTRWTNRPLDVLAWIPYGVLHFAAPFIVSGSLWVFGPRGAVEYFGEAFGWMNLLGVLCQILIPCAPPWYELRNGSTPADYSMSGSPGGLARIDALFGSTGYTNAFTSSPVVFGAFPSLHAGCSTMEALFLSHFFPRGRAFWWGYVFWLYWSAMYLTHHYLVDLVAGGSLAVICFYYFLPEDLRHLYPPVSTDPAASGLVTSANLLSSASGFMNGGGEEKGYGSAALESWEDEPDDYAGGRYS